MASVAGFVLATEGPGRGLCHGMRGESAGGAAAEDGGGVVAAGVMGADMSCVTKYVDET
eukprot:SAG22_NODE_925_length_6469_cov_3.836264_6_plen_59_part_00